MAKNPFGTQDRRWDLQEAGRAVIALAVLALVIKHPHDAAGVVNTAADEGGGIIDGVVEFFRAYSATRLRDLSSLLTRTRSVLCASSASTRAAHA